MFDHCRDAPAPRMPVGNEGFAWDPLLKMVN